MSTTFSLLCLPKKALHHVVYSIDYIDIVAFSLTSNKTKEVVKSLKLEINNISLTLDYIIRIQIDDFRNSTSPMIWNFYPEKDYNSIEPIPIYMSAHVEGVRDVNPRQTLAKYRNPGLSIREWLAHFQYIFSFPGRSPLLFGSETCKFELSSLKETIGKSDVTTLVFYNSCSLECAQMVLRQFPFIKRFFACSQSFEDPSMYRNILIQNFDTLVLGHRTTSVKIELDELLLINSKEIHIRSTTITDNVINRFLKHWIEGSNPRMDVVSFDFRDGRFLDKNAILKGTNYREVLLNEVRHSKRFAHGIIEVKGGYDIRRKDGNVGTVSILQQGQKRMVQFFIWS
ncbi:hypothetical protein GCK72_004588 [Caenorhabditis remanei]|uniref:F-box domain-containing protein n=1 Tax=Caenorhabditis remanei TaxID=31234 RepID=E3MHV5_CAERE|nr:hypothetical protein GCK72_004588 [Caenorhabditis remanei]EFP02200.1 hypothetical protein CRE_24940 [Caenorhabditis remanei]KAF1764639.1 hypothetical protein GCK72_004588 [Caenorhabditis remanei]